VSLAVRRFHRVALAVSFAVPLLAYALTLCPTVHWGDTGEFLVAAMRLGIPHSPGTPLYPVLGRCASLLIPSRAPLAVNLMSGLFAALSAVFVYLSIFRILAIRTSNPRLAEVAGALAGSLVWASATSLWSYSTVAEVYTLQMAFVSGLLLAVLTLLSRVGKDLNLLPFLFYAYGLSLSSNITILLLFPAFCILLWRPLVESSVRQRLLIAAFFLLGLTPYLYLPLRSIHNPPLDWGNPETMSQFAWVLTAREFAGKMMGLTYALKGGFSGIVRTYYSILSKDLTLVEIVLAAVGVFSCWLISRRLLLSLSVLYVTTLAYSLAFGADLELEAYLLPSLLVLVLLVGLGASRIISLARTRIAIVVTVALLALPVVSFSLRFAQMDLRDNRYAEMTGEALLMTTEEDGIFFTDNTVDLFSALYVQTVEGIRPDVALVYLPHVEYGWYREEFRRQHGLSLPAEGTPLLEFMEERNSSYTPLTKPAVPAEFLLPNGIAFRVKSDSLTESVIARSDSALAPVDSGTKAADYDTRRHFAIVHSYMGEYYYERARPELSAREYRKASEVMPENCEIRFNLARALEEMGELESAASEYQKSLAVCRQRLASLSGLGRVALKRGEFDLSAEYLSGATSVNPRDPRLFYNLGLARLALGDLEGAADANQRAVELKPDFPEALTNWGVCYLRMGRGSEAARLFERAISVDSSCVQAYLNLAEYYVAADSGERSEEILRNGLRKDLQGFQYNLLRQKLSELGKTGK
jgi:tetratricopeptide (TPR) repeat protein